MKEHISTIALWQEKQMLQENLAALEDELNTRFGAVHGNISARGSPRAVPMDAESQEGASRSEEGNDYTAAPIVTGASEAQPVSQQNFQFGAKDWWHNMDLPMQQDESGESTDKVQEFA